jgi:hypothetical protein
VNKMQKLMAAIEELERMRGHCQACIAQGTSTWLPRTEPSGRSKRTSPSSDAQLVEAINAHPETHSLTPHV